MSKINIKKTNYKNIVMIGLCIMMAVSSIFMTLVTATSSAEVSSLQKEGLKLSNEKRTLENGLIKSLSMDKLEQKGLEIGFIKPEVLVYVESSEVVAQLPQH